MYRRGLGKGEMKGRETYREIMHGSWKRHNVGPNLDSERETGKEKVRGRETNCSSRLPDQIGDWHEGTTQDREQEDNWGGVQTVRSTQPSSVCRPRWRNTQRKPRVQRGDALKIPTY